MSCYMTLSEVLPSLPYRFVYWLYLLPYAWNMEYKFCNSQILFTLFMEGPTTFCGSGKMLHKDKEPQRCVWPFWHSCWVCSANTLPQHTHTHVALSCILCKSQWFLCSWCTSRWKGDWNVKILSFVVSCLCICTMHICDGKVSNRSQILWKAWEFQQMKSL